MAKSTIYKGNTINNFGRNFPVPYIERVEIYDVLEDEREDLPDIVGFEPNPEDPVSKITIKMSMLINTDDDFMLEDFVSDLFNDLSLNIIALTDQTRIESLKHSKKNLKEILSRMYVYADDPEEEPETSTPSLDAPSFDGLYSQIKSEPLSAFAADIGFTGEYDENTNRILKSSNITYNLYVPGIADKVTDLTIFVGTSIGPPEQLMQFQDIVMAMSFGDLAYETIKADGSLANRNKIGYFDQGDAYYPGKPIVALNGNYYQSEAYDQDNIRNDIKDLMEEYKQDLAQDRDLQTVFDNLDAIYAEYGETPKYLAQLNRYRSNIMNQDQATRAGRFYERYRRLLINANAKLLESKEVFKRITYATKIRDFRPSQWAGDLESTYDEDLGDDDFLYNVFFHTNLAKYVSARSGPGEDSLFEPEAPYDPAEMLDAYTLAIKTIGSRFDVSQNRSSFTQTPGGVYMAPNNAEDWIYEYLSMYKDQARVIFKEAIGNWIAWACDMEYTASSTAGGEGHFGPSNYRRIYRGGAGSGQDDGDYNLGAFYSAKYLFMYHGGDDKSSGCQLEFGKDSPRIGDGWNCSNTFANLGDSEYNIHTHSERVSDPSRRYSQYKCFEQLLPIINLVGHGDDENTDIGEQCQRSDGEGGTESYKCGPGRYGYFLKVRSAKNTKYGDKWRLKFPSDIMPRIEAILDSDDDANPLSPDGLDVVGMLSTGARISYNAFGEGASNDYLPMIQDVDLWNSLVAANDLLKDDGTVKSGKLNDYADKVVSDMREVMNGFLNLVQMSVPTFRLRWCPDTTSNTDWLDSNRESDNNPYGGRWHRLESPQRKRDSSDRSWDSRSRDSLEDYWFDGACGTAGYTTGWESAASGPPTGVPGIGRAAWNPAFVLIEQIKSTFSNVYAPMIKDAVKDIIPLLAELHGLNIAAGLHRRLSYMDIVVEKYGYFFFDLEKYIKQRSVISRYINPSTFEKYFVDGRDMLNRSIRIDDVIYERWNAGWDGEDWVGVWYGEGGFAGGKDLSTTLKMTWNPSSKSSNQPTDIVRMKFNSQCTGAGPRGGGCAYSNIDQMDISGWKDIAISGEGDEAVLTDDETGETIRSYNQWSYLMQRNYDFAYDTSVPDEYRMACFAYNYYIDDDIALAKPDAVATTVNVRDKSDLIIKYLRRYLTNINEEYQEYAELARENCAYNHIDSQFNQFFINQMDENYGLTPTSSPWLRASSAYVIFQDLLYGRYGGEFSIVLDAARAIADTVNPKTGDLESVEDFALKLNEMVLLIDGIYADMIDDVYDGSGETRLFEYVTFTIGDPLSRWGAPDIIINKGIIDYASDHTDEFPSLPDPDMGI
jgi:hypothetical protein